MGNQINKNFGSDNVEYKICYEDKEIYINKSLESETELEFIKAVVDIIHYHEEIPTPAPGREVLSKALYRMLKINSCFTGS